MPCSSNCNVIFLYLAQFLFQFRGGSKVSHGQCSNEAWKTREDLVFFWSYILHATRNQARNFRQRATRHAGSPGCGAKNPLFHQKLVVEILENGMLIVGFNYHMAWSWFLLDSSKLAIHGGRDRTSQDADGQYPFAHARDRIHRLDGWATWVGNVLNFKGTYIRTYRFFRCFRCVFFLVQSQCFLDKPPFLPRGKPSVSHSLDWDFHFQVTCVKPLQLQ